MDYIHNFEQVLTDEEVLSQIIKEKESAAIGYYDLVHQDTSKMKEYAKGVKQTNIVVIGIGGSTLGTYAIYQYLKDSHSFSKKLFFLETTDPIDIQSTLSQLDINDTLFVIISKSGTTIETISIFKYIHTLVNIDKSNTLIITEYDSKLNAYAQAHDMKTFEIPKNVGGRFSVFTSVGLVPLAIVGVDIDALLAGAKEMHDAFFTQGSDFNKRLLQKARFITDNKETYNVNVVFSYASRLDGFNKWYVQLWGESLGKLDAKGLRHGGTPIGITGPVDQHSFLQLVMEGRRDKTMTVIKVEDFNNDLMIPDVTLEGLEDLNYINNLTFSSLINQQADATIAAIHNLKDVPCDVITIAGVNEQSIAGLMYEYELLTSACSKFLHINAYDQPGVEAGKIILKEQLQNAKN